MARNVSIWKCKHLYTSAMSYCNNIACSYYVAMLFLPTLSITELHCWCQGLSSKILWPFVHSTTSRLTSSFAPLTHHRHSYLSTYGDMSKT